MNQATDHQWSLSFLNKTTTQVTPDACSPYHLRRILIKFLEILKLDLCQLMRNKGDRDIWFNDTAIMQSEKSRMWKILYDKSPKFFLMI